MTKENSASEHLKSAHNYREEGKFDLALKEFGALLAEESPNETAILELGKTYKMMNRCPDAVQEFIKVVRINPDNREALWELGATSRMSNNCEMAEEVLKEAALKSPSNEQVCIELSKIFQKKNQYEQAFNELDKALKISKSNSEVYICFGQLYLAKGERDKAISSFRHAIEVNPGEKNARLELANIYEREKKYADAIKEIEEVAKISPLDIQSRLKLVKFYNLENNFDLSEKETQGILSLNPGNTLFHDTMLNEIEILQRKTIIKSKVKRLWVTLTSRCNIRCRTCGLWSSPWDIPRKTVDEVLQLYPYLERLVWLGGEVFLCKYFDELFEKVLEYPGLQQQVITNGVILTEKWIERILRANAELTISVDGITKEIYEHIREGASFEKLMTNIKLANQIKQSVLSKTPMRLNAVIMKSNYHQLEDFIDFAHEFGFCQVSLMALHFDEDPEENILYSHVDTKVLEYITNTIPKLREKAKQYNIDLDILLPTLDSGVGEPQAEVKTTLPPPTEALHCKMPWKYMFICDKGTVYLTGSCAKPIGNIYRNSLDEIWNSPEAQQYRLNMLKNDFQDMCRPECRTRWEV